MAMAADAGKRFGAGKGFFAVYAPLLFVLAYLLVTYLIFLLGPLQWNLSTQAYLWVTALAVGCMAALALGYGLNMRRGHAIVSRGVAQSSGYGRLGRVMSPLFVASALFNIVTVWAKLLLMYSPAVDLWQCVLNPGLGYVQGQNLQELYEAGNIPDSVARYGLLFKALTFFSGLTVFYYPLGWLCWPRLRLWEKLLFAAALFSTLLFYWIIGTQMGFGMLVFAALPVLLYRAACVRREAARGTEKPRRMGKWFRAYRSVLVQAIALLLAFVLLFGGMQVARAGAKQPGADEGNVVGRHGNFTYRYGGSTNPKASSFAVTMLSFYAGHGYAGLAKAMGLPFEWTYGLNGSYGLLQLSEKYLGVSGVWERSYLYRNEQVNGWPALVYWSTLYAWLASDVTYWGVPVIMLGLGVFFAAVWKDLAVRRSAMASVVLGQLFILFVMIPANNQLFNTMSALFSSLLVLALYLFSRTAAYARWNGEESLGEGGSNG